MKALSLNLKLFLLICSSLVLTISISVAVTLYTNQQTLIHSTFRHLSVVAEMKKKELEALFDDIFIDISILARSRDIVELSQTLARQHREVLKSSPEAHSTMDVNACLEIASRYEEHLYSYMHEYHYDNLYLIDHDHGHILFSFNKALIGHDLSVAHARYNALYGIWQKSLNAKRTLFSDLTLSAHADKPVMFIATPVYDETSRQIATLVLQMDYAVINDIMTMTTSLQSRSEECYLTGQDKLPRSDTRLDQKHRTLLASLQEPEHARIDTFASNAALNGERGEAEIVDYRGVEVFSSYTPVHVSEELRWALLAEVDRSDVLAFSPELMDALIVMSLFLFPLVLGITQFLLHYNLIRPLTHLTGAILKISQSGEKLKQLPLCKLPELNKIIQSFNTLLSSLEKADTQLQRSQLYIKKGEEIAGIGIWALEVENNELYWGENTYKIFGLPPDTEVNLETFVAHVHPDDREEVMNAYNNSVAKGCDYRIEHRIVREDGTVGYVEERCSHIFDQEGKVKTSIGTVFDFTKQKKLEQKLQQLNESLELKVYEKTEQLHTSLEQFKHLFNNTLEGIVISDMKKIYDVNEQAVKIFGYENKERLMSSTPDNLIADEYLDAVKTAVELHSTPVYEIRLKRQDGSTFPALVKGHNMPTQKGVLRISTILDISDMKEKESQMLRQSRQAMMGEMLAMIAHQWRQPLASIAATSATLQMKILIDSYDKTFFTDQLQNIGKFSLHLSKTIDDFRNFFKAEKNISTFPLEEVINSSLTIMESSLQAHNIAVECRFESDIVATSYENELKQVILNLIKNAEDILLERHVKDPSITLKTYRDGSSVCMSVSDNGGGVPSHLLNRIFDPYFTTKDELNGTGLGLYMSKTIIEEHCSGTLTLLNSDSGATFIISLPTAIPDPVRQRSDQAL